jgi:uncharacterized LabA/DUF88 family protein
LDKCILLVDNTNLFIGGQQLSAKRKGVRRHSRHGHDPCDPSWRLDFKGLKDCLAQGRHIHAAVMVGSAPPDIESAWEEAAEEAGFTVVVQEMDRRHEEKAVDTELVARGTEIICSAEEPMVLVLASGDRDYVPLMDVAHRNGWKVEMCAFTSSFPPHGDLADAADKVRPLDDCLDEIGHCAFTWPE